MSKIDNQPAFQASDPHYSAWVAANAGSGKTFVLVTRLVRLMLSGVAPEKLLCLTYTRSAAAEMQDRLFTLLAEWALLDDAALHKAIGERLGTPDDEHDLPLARMLFARALESPGGLRVQTIHSFCESLLKRFPLEAGLSPQFDLLDEQDAQDLQAQIIRRLLSHEDDTALRSALDALTRQLSEPDLDKLAHTILSQRDHFDTARQRENLTKLAQSSGLDHLGEEARNPESIANTHMQEYTSRASELANWLAASEQTTNQQRGHDLGKFIDAMENQQLPQAWAALSQVFLTGDGSPRKSLVTKTYAEKQPNLADDLVRWGERFDEVTALYRASFTYQMTQALYVFAESLIRDYAAVKDQRGVLDYDDLISCTNQMLSQKRAAAWVLFKIDNGLEHILVDEAQDTSPAQWRVIRTLADEFFAGETANPKQRTIFAVGDEKQSIFSFQGADPAGFNAQYEHFNAQVSEIGGAVNYVRLLNSWRSAPEVLQVVDQLFSTSETARGLSAAGAPTEHIAQRDKATGYVALWEAEQSTPISETDEASELTDMPVVDLPETTRQKLARRIADKIAAWQADATCDIRPGDILILVRKRDDFVDDMIRALDRRNIRVAGADRMVLLEQIAILDLMAAAEFALNPNDDLTLACFLRSPLGGLDETALFDLAYGRSGSLWAALKAAVAAGGDDKLKSAHQRLSWLLAQVDYLRPYDYFAQLLTTQDGHALMRGRLGTEIDDAIGEFLRLALVFESRHVASMQGFLHFLRQGQQTIKRDMENRQDAVRIMTVHGAKGLEAPIVFLPDTCSRPGGSAQRGVVQMGQQKIPFWRANRKMREAHGQAEEENAMQSEQDESKRLLYVALTRARDRLYIGGYLNKRAKTPPKDSWYQMIADELQKDKNLGEDMGRPIWSLGDEHKAMPERKTNDQPSIDPGPAPSWVGEKISKQEARENIRAEKIFAPSTIASPSANTASNKGGNNEAMLAGHISHSLFEHLPTVPKDQRAAAAQAYVSLHGQSLAPNTQEKLIANVLTVMADPQIAELFAPHSRAEAPIAGFLTRTNGTQMQFHGQIDRYVETDQAIYLVDFKTGSVPDVDDIADAYVLQMAVYQALMRAVRGTKPIRCGLVWTQACRVDWLDDERLASSLANMLSGA